MKKSIEELKNILKSHFDSQQLSEATYKNIITWLSAPYASIKEGDKNAHELIESLIIEEKIQELEDRFFKVLSPGTAGIRGRMGVGSALINAATIGTFAKAHSNYLSSHPLPDRSGIVLGFDSRKGSYDMETKGPGELTKMIAEIYAASGIPVFVSLKPVPTPVIAHTIVEIPLNDNGTLVQTGGICTASHNPKEDNGYKIYETDGHQVVNDDFKIDLQKEIDKIQSFSQVTLATPTEGWPQSEEEYVQKLAQGNGKIQLTTQNAPITIIDTKLIIAQYVQKAREVALEVNEEMEFKSYIKDALKKSPIIITALKGNLTETVTQLLESHGLKENLHFYSVPEERDPDNSLDTGLGEERGQPNPSNTSSFYRAKELAEKLEASGIKVSYLFASDPDSDRLGVVERGDSEISDYYFSGNEQISINSCYESTIVEEPEKALVLKSLVSSNQCQKIYKKNWPSVKFIHVLVGFKYFGQIIAHYNNTAISYLREHGNPNFSRKDYGTLTLKERTRALIDSGSLVFRSGGEESMGQTYGTDCAEKDTPRAMARFAEICGWLTHHKITMKDYLKGIHNQYDLHQEKLINKKFPGAAGDQQKKEVMDHFRQESSSPKSFGSQKVIGRMDFQRDENKVAKCFSPESGHVLFDSNDERDEFSLPGSSSPTPTFTIKLDKKKTLKADDSNYLVFFLENGSTLQIRPSGTEPILKIYLNLELKDEEIKELPSIKALLTQNQLCGTGFSLQNEESVKAIELDPAKVLMSEDYHQNKAAFASHYQNIEWKISSWKEWTEKNQIQILKIIDVFQNQGVEKLEKTFEEIEEALDQEFGKVLNKGS